MTHDYDLFYQSRQERLPRFPDPYGSVVAYRMINQLFNAIDKLGSNLNILEIGSGSGQYPLWITSHYPRHKIAKITAIDESKWSMDYANAYVKKMGIKNIHYHQASAEKFHPKEEFDFIYSIEVVEHVEDRKAFLKNIYSLLKPGGSLFITTPNNHSYLHYLRPIKNLLNKKEEYNGLATNMDIEEEHKFLYTTKSLARELKEAGFTDMRFQRNSVVYPGAWCDRVGLPLILFEKIAPSTPFLSWGIVTTCQKPK